MLLALPIAMSMNLDKESTRHRRVATASAQLPTLHFLRLDACLFFIKLHRLMNMQQAHIHSTMIRGLGHGGLMLGENRKIPL